jgi:dTDP-4-amino-4,6-dideoxygalactose transaminase
MTIIGSVPRRCVNLPPGSFIALIRSILDGNRQEAAIEKFHKEFAHWLGASHALGTSSGRSAFQLALQALGMKKGAEIIFPVFTFPVIPLVAKLLGYQPVFCDVDPKSYNSGPEHIEPRITDNTGAILATHLFGQPCAIRDIADMAHQRNIHLLEDCAHACGVRVGGRQVGTFGDIGVFSFAEGKNMPCFGGGAIVTSDDNIAQKARQILSQAPVPSRDAITKNAFSVWFKWLLTRPFIFGLTVYPALRLKLLLGQPLMDSVGGDELLDAFKNSNPRISRMSHLQAAVGLLQLNHIDTFNEGARRNARILSEELGEVPGIGSPETVEGDHIFVYYPLRVEPDKRDDLRHYLLKHGFDSKTSDMYDCTALRLFQPSEEHQKSQNERMEASILEICVYPVIAQTEMRRLARNIRAWAGLPANQRPPAKLEA